MNTEESKLFNETIGLIKEYLNDIEDPNLKVTHDNTPETLREQFDLTLNDKGVDEDTLLASIKKYMDLSVKTNAKQFHNQLFAGTNIPSILGEFVAAVMNGSNYTFEASPIGSMIEIELINKMGSKIGFKDQEGTFLTGGSNANLIALLCARTWKFPESKSQGNSVMGKAVLFVSEECHYSFDKAANVMGLGTSNVHYVKADEYGRMIPDDLEIKIKKSLENGENPFFVGATSSTTEHGSFDPINEIADIAKKYDLWLHIDGAWGGSILMSNTHKHLLKGCERADSFTWDAHKMMNVPLICSAVIVSKIGVLEKAASTGLGDYLFHEHPHQYYDLGHYSIQCGKKIDVLKLWLAWKYYGDEGYESFIDKMFDNAQWVTNYIKDHNDLELLIPTFSLNVNFRILNSKVEDLNKYNSKIRDVLTRSGKSLCNYCNIDGKFSFRLITNNPKKNTSDFEQFFVNLFEAKEEVDKTL